MVVLELLVVFKLLLTGLQEEELLAIMFLKDLIHA